MTIEYFVLDENDWVPNNARLAVIVYRGSVQGTGEAAASRFEALFEEHGWPPQWRDGVYDFHHYHSTAHEALGIARGSARLMLGGPGGREVAVAAGDALILPVGTGHCRIAASDDFLVVGAYPQGQDWDLCPEAPSPDARERMHRLPIPDLDPVAGAGGALQRLWASPDRSRV